MNEIDINLEDLDEPGKEGESGPAAGDDDLLVIEPEDLEGVEPLPSVPTSYPAAPPLSSPPFGPAVGPALKSTLGLTQFAGWSLIHLALAGAAGGFLAWAFSEPFTNDLEGGGPLLIVLLSMTAFGAFLGGMIGAALGSVEGITGRVVEKALRGAGLGLLIGGAGGAVGGLIGQVLYGALGGGGERYGLMMQVVVRGLAWALVGAGVGLGQGAMTATSRKLINGLIGGAIGGLVGGLLFDPISLVLSLITTGAGPHGGWLSRMVAMTVMGACTGVAIGLVEELRKEAWLIIVQGPLVGKQFILYRSPTVIGSSPKADICLLKDPAIRPQHLVLQQAGEGHLLLASPEAMVAVNGRPVTRQRLRSGDVIGLGQTVLEYRLRAVSPVAAQ